MNIYQYRRNSKRLFLTFIILLMIFIGVGYAYLTSNLKINGVTNILKNTWDIHFENINMINNTTQSSEPSLTDENTVIHFTTNLKVPTDEYSFSVKVVNAGSIDAMLSEVAKWEYLEVKKSILSLV